MAQVSRQVNEGLCQPDLVITAACQNLQEEVFSIMYEAPEQQLEDFIWKDPENKYVQFCGPYILCPSPQLHRNSLTIAIINKKLLHSVWIPMKLHLQKQVASWFNLLLYFRGKSNGRSESIWLEFPSSSTSER